MIVRVSPIVADSFAETRARSRLGIAMAAMMPMIATTMSSSIRVKPFWFFIITPLCRFGACEDSRHASVLPSFKCLIQRHVVGSQWDGGDKLSSSRQKVSGASDAPAPGRPRHAIEGGLVSVRMVPEVGLEPTLAEANTALNRAR